MTLRLSYFVPPLPLIEAQERGLLDGIDLVETCTTGSPAQLHGLHRGELDVVVTAIDNLFEWPRAGADVRLLGQVEQTTPLTIHAAPDVSGLSGLEGRRFAVDAYANGFALTARYLLQRSGTTVEWVEVGGVSERLEALTLGAVEATLLGPPFEQRAVAAGFPVLERVQDSFPGFPGQGLVTRSALLGTPELEELLAVLCGTGLLETDRAGLDVLTGIRASLGLLPPGADLHALVAR